MRANPDEIRTIGESLLSRTTAAQAEPLASTATGSGPLGQQVLAAHAQQAAAATQFLDTAHQGIAQAASALVQFAGDMTQVSQGGADSITQALG